MNPDTLERLNRAYVEIKGRYEDRLPAFHEIDTGGNLRTSPRDTAFDVVTKIIEHFEK